MEQQYNGRQIPQNDVISQKSRNPQISLTTKHMSLRSAVILIAGKDVDSLTLLLPFVKAMLTFLALTIYLTLDSKMVATMVALTILMMNQKDTFCTMSPQLPDTFKLLLQCLGLLEGMAITLSLLVLSNVAFTPMHLFHLGPLCMAKWLCT
jgi:hypothetical protein